MFFSTNPHIAGDVTRLVTHLETQALPGLLPQISVNSYHSERVGKTAQLVGGSNTTHIQSLTPLQHAVVLGGLLGDFHIQRTTASTQRCRLRVCHNIAQKDYVDWKYTVLREPFCKGVKPPHETARPGEYVFYTMYRDEFIPYRGEWYRNDGNGFRKRVPNKIDTLLVDPISLAVWYLDDGTKRNDSDSCRLATQGFSLQENQALSNCLWTNFSIYASIDTWRPARAKKPLYGLSIQSKSGGYKRLRLLISDFVRAEVPTMLYKLK
jgi:hypothetical protein